MKFNIILFIKLTFVLHLLMITNLICQTKFLLKDNTEIIGIKKFNKNDTLIIVKLDANQIEIIQKDILKEEELIFEATISYQNEVRGTLIDITPDSFFFKNNNGFAYNLEKKNILSYRLIPVKTKYFNLGTSLLSPTWWNLVLGYNFNKDFGVRVAGNNLFAISKGYQIDAYYHLKQFDNTKIGLGISKGYSFMNTATNDNSFYGTSTELKWDYYGVFGEVLYSGLWLQIGLTGGEGYILERSGDAFKQNNLSIPQILIQFGYIYSFN